MGISSKALIRLFKITFFLLKATSYKQRKLQMFILVEDWKREKGAADERNIVKSCLKS